MDHSDFDAHEHAIAAAINDGKRERVVLCGDDGHQYTATGAMLQPWGLTLDAAEKDYGGTLQLLGDFTLVETARSFAAARITVCHATVGQTIQELIELKIRNVESVPAITDFEITG